MARSNVAFGIEIIQLPDRKLSTLETLDESPAFGVRLIVPLALGPLGGYSQAIVRPSTLVSASPLVRVVVLGVVRVPYVVSPGCNP